MIISKCLSNAAIIFCLTILGAAAKPPAGTSDTGSHVNKGVELAQQRKAPKPIGDRRARRAKVAGILFAKIRSVVCEELISHLEVRLCWLPR